MKLPAWHEYAACRRTDPSLFYEPDNRAPTGQSAIRVREAKAVCAGCAVLTDCRTYALTAKERFGVWGGMSEDERQAHWKTTGSPQPRKHINEESRMFVRILARRGLPIQKIARLSEVSRSTVRKIIESDRVEVAS